MRGRIFKSIMLLAALCLAFVSVLFCVVFYSHFLVSVRAELQQRASGFSDNTAETVLEVLTSPTVTDVRISLILADGTVLYDNVASADEMGNHLIRNEVLEAIKTGTGESRRFSKTLGEESYYYAVKLQDGSVLRLSKTVSSISELFLSLLPTLGGVILLTIIAGYFLAGNLTKQIVEPINNVQLNADMAPPYDELIPFIQMISEQRNYIEHQIGELKNRTDTIEAIMDNMSEGMVITDQDGTVLTVNKSAALFFDVAATATGKNLPKLFSHENLRESMYKVLDGIRSETSFEHENKMYRAYFSPVQDSGAIVLFLDITERLNVERLRQEFSANVSHELKTPLTTIYGNAEMLSNGMVKKSDKQMFYEKIQDETSRLITLVDDIILISRLDEGASKSYELFENVDISTVAAEAVSALSQKAADKNVDLHLIGTNAEMRASRSQIYELFLNLIDNSIKYNYPGGKIYIECKTLENGEINISISDTGIGIAKESQDRVFERFYRIDKSRSKSTGGTGLGLAIVKHIVRSHKGKINLESTENEGTTIQIIFNKEP